MVFLGSSIENYYVNLMFGYSILQVEPAGRSRFIDLFVKIGQLSPLRILYLSPCFCDVTDIVYSEVQIACRFKFFYANKFPFLSFIFKKMSKERKKSRIHSRNIQIFIFCLITMFIEKR